MLALTVAGVVGGVVVGLLRGGTLERLAYLPIRWPWLTGFVWLLQALLFASPLAGALEPVAGTLNLASLVLLAVVIVVNRALPGLALFGAGLLLNAAVLSANGGYMPVSDRALVVVGRAEALESMRGGARVQKTFLMQPDTPLWFLGDLLPLPPVGKIYSVGDLVASVGVFALVVGGMTRRVARPAPIPAAAAQS